MSDVAKSKELLRRYSIARIPFIAINTIERARNGECKVQSGGGGNYGKVV